LRMLAVALLCAALLPFARNAIFSHAQPLIYSANGIGALFFGEGDFSTWLFAGWILVGTIFITRFTVTTWFAAIALASWALVGESRQALRELNRWSSMRLAAEYAGDGPQILLFHALPAELSACPTPARHAFAFFHRDSGVLLPLQEVQAMKSLFGEKHVGVRYSSFGATLDCRVVKSPTDLIPGALLLTARSCGTPLASTSGRTPQVSIYRIGDTPCAVQELFRRSEPLVIEEFGPRTTLAGQGFNLQPDGASAMWFRTTGANETTVVIADGVALKSTYHSPKLVTAIIPRELFSRPRTHEFQLLDESADSRSNSVQFSVN
jgi:hypothetical protein